MKLSKIAGFFFMCVTGVCQRIMKNQDVAVGLMRDIAEE